MYKYYCDTNGAVYHQCADAIVLWRVSVDRRQAAGADNLRLLGPLESHQAWVLLQSDQLLLVNPLRLCEMATLSRLLTTYRFPWRPLPEPRVIAADTVGEEQYSSLQNLTRDGARVVDERVLANGFCVEVAGETARVTGLADCINLYGVKDLSELLQKIAADPTTSLAQCRPLRAVSWLQVTLDQLRRCGLLSYIPHAVSL